MNNIATAMQCNGGVYRVEDNNTVYIYDSYEELTEYYEILGVITPSMFLTFAVNRRA